MGFIQEGSGKVVYKRILRLDNDNEMQTLETWRELMSNRMNLILDQLSGAIVSGSGGLYYDHFAGNAVQTEFILTKKVKSGSVPIVLTPSGQLPDTSWKIEPFSDVQDKIVFSWTPRLNTAILVYYQPAN